VNNEILLKALSQYGIKEISGALDNQIILDYFAAAGHAWVQDDETAWCSAFACWVAEQVGCEHPHSLRARDFLTVGDPVLEPEQGDIVVYWRVEKDSVYGHVHFFVSQDDKVIYGIGGNQNNMVTISPYLKSRLLGYRRLKKVT
jgi:uncharacterized protein (TIGR02594 family)